MKMRYRDSEINELIKGKFGHQPTDEQLNILKSFIAGDNIVINAAAGSGKAQPLYSKIKAAEGWTTMGKIKIGDVVEDGFGGLCNVIGVYPQAHLKGIYEITLTNNSKARCCLEHLWLVDDINACFNEDYDIILSLGEIIKNGFDNYCIPRYEGGLSYHAIKYIEFKGFEEAQCIEVDSITHTYVTDDYIVTHNTGSLQMMSTLNNGKGLYLAFNKSMAEEAGQKFGANVTCRTTHSLAFNAMLKHYPKNRLLGNLQSKDIVKFLKIKDTKTSISLDINDTKIKMTMDYSALRVVADIKATLNTFFQSDDLDPIEKHISVDSSISVSRSRLIKMIIKQTIKFNNTSDARLAVNYMFNCSDAYDTILAHRINSEQCIETLRTRYHIAMHESVDFRHETNENYTRYVINGADLLWNDMLDIEDGISNLTHDGYLKIYILLKPELKYDYIFLDEAQDSSLAIKSLIDDQKVQRVIVGDKFQNIYGFRGSKNIMELFPEFQKHLLTTSFRLNSATAAIANMIIGYDSDFKIKGFRNTYESDDEQICYLYDSNQKLINRVLSLADQGITDMRILGGVNSIKRVLSDALNSVTGERISNEDSLFYGFKSFYDALDYYTSLTGNLARDDGVKTVCLLANLLSAELAKGSEDVKLKLTRLATIFENCDKKDISCKYTIATVHSSKGLEFDTVIYEPLDRSRLPINPPPAPFLSLSRYAKPSNESSRVDYVAMTRAKRRIIGLGVYVDDHDSMSVLTKKDDAALNRNNKDKLQALYDFSDIKDVRTNMASSALMLEYNKLTEIKTKIIPDNIVGYDNIIPVAEDLKVERKSKNFLKDKIKAARNL